jgi:hypothetical protein
MTDLDGPAQTVTAPTLARRLRSRGFVVAQVLGGAIAILTIRALYPDVSPADAATVVLPHQDDCHAETNLASAVLRQGMRG